MKVTVSIDGVLAEHLRRSLQRADPVVQDALHEIGTEFVFRAETIAPGSRFGQSFEVTRTGRAVEAGTTSPLGAILERGRKPGARPSPQSIVKRNGGSMEAAERAADRIAAHGTRGKFTVKRANQSLRRDGTIERIARRALVKIVEGR